MHLVNVAIIHSLLCILIYGLPNNMMVCVYSCVRILFLLVAVFLNTSNAGLNSCTFTIKVQSHFVKFEIDKYMYMRVWEDVLLFRQLSSGVSKKSLCTSERSNTRKLQSEF